MQPVKDTNRSYEVERRSHYAARPGFRIAEMQISPTQTIPWHYHSKSQDTFYVIQRHDTHFHARARRGRAPRRWVKPILFVRDVLILSLMLATPQPYFWSCREWASTISLLLPDGERLAARGTECQLGVLAVRKLWRPP